jgi:carbonic anhydrase
MTLDRRTFLKFGLIGLGTVGFGTVGFGTRFETAVLAAEDDRHRWGYTGSTSPEHWSELTPDYAACARGQRQSPIDLVDAIPARLAPPEINYRSTPIELIHTGHTIQLNYAPGSTLTLDGQTFNLLQFHFHSPSEHQIEGQPQAMECHFVHQTDDSEALLVLAVFLQLGQNNDVLEPLWAHLPMTIGETYRDRDTTIDASQLLPARLDRLYRYDGSLTTPPCRESVTWLLCADPLTVSIAQVDRFTQAIPANARPVQARNHRPLLRSRSI